AGARVRMRDRGMRARLLVVGDGGSLRCGHRSLELLAGAAMTDALDGGDRPLRRAGAREREGARRAGRIRLLDRGPGVDLLHDCLHCLVEARGDRAEAVLTVVEVAGTHGMAAAEDPVPVELVVDDGAADERRVE